MIRVEKTHLPVAALTHPGMKGKNNEDRFGVSAFHIKSRPATPVLLAVLSDGVGGNRAGEVASELAVNLVSQYAAESNGQEPVQILREAIQQASQKIFQQAQANVHQRGMGATCACVWISGDRLYTATVGDSRIYRMHDGAIQQLSTDHTWVQEALERGLIQPDDVAGHPNAHVIRRYLGSPNPPAVDFRIRLSDADEEEPSESHQGLQLSPNDRILLCSDGLTDLVQPDEILAAFQQFSLEEAGQQLIDLANQRGGHDNITLVAVQIPDPQIQKPAPARFKMPLSRVLALSCLGVVLLATLTGVLAGGWLLYSDKNANPTAPPTLTGTVIPTRPRATQVVSPTGTLNRASTPLPPSVTSTVMQLIPGLAATLTPWPTNTPVLPIVTVSR